MFREAPMPIGAEKRLERRRHMLQSVRDLLGRVGYDEATMKALAAESGVTIPTLYNIFGGRDELLYEAVLEPMKRCFPRLGRVPGRGGSTVSSAA